MGYRLIVYLTWLLFVLRNNALKYDAQEALWNLNTNRNATHPLEYSGEWDHHVYTPSPPNWRLPFYTIMLDRFVNGDPSNDNANGTQFEQDITQTQLRHGGDIQGLKDSLDYLQGMGIKVLYLAGSPHLNMPWSSDGYSPLDFTLLDHHFGTIAEWQDVIAEIHHRGMYVVLDNTMSTMSDLIGFEGYLNTSTPFASEEHNALWKSDQRYPDFDFGNEEVAKCDYPRFYGDDGMEVNNLTTELVGCRDSEFDQYGEIAAFGNYPEWQRQISKFAFVQDRLREWRPDVLSKIEHFACITLAMLDIDGYRMDKGLMITVDAQAHWSESIRQCARKYGKENFYISGEIVSGNTFGSVYIGRGRTPAQYVNDTTQAVLMTNTSDDKFFIRDLGKSAFDGAAFHYTVYRFLTRILGMDGTFAAEGDPPTDWVEFWNTILQTNDLVNANTGKFDPRHMYGVTNQDVFRWPAIANGTQKQLLGMFFTTLLLPGIPTLVWGEEQAFYVMDNTASNYVFGRSPMSSSQAWEMHGCFTSGNSKYYQFPVETALRGCTDDSINLDHRDPSNPIRNIIKSTYEMRENYPVLNDGFSIKQLSKQTHQNFLPGSNHTPTETGMWSMERAGWDGAQSINQTVWLVYGNENVDKIYSSACDGTSALLAPFAAGTTVRNLYSPYETYTLESSSTGMPTDDSKSNGCLSQLQLAAWGFKAFVPEGEFITPTPVITKFLPGHDIRLISTEIVGIELHFSAEMDCDQIKEAIYVNSTTMNNQTAKLDSASSQCKNISSAQADPSPWSGGVSTKWVFIANLTNVSDGVHEVTVKNVSISDGKKSTNSVDHFLLRVGQPNNPVVFPKTANYSSTILSRDSTGALQLSHNAQGADRFRYSLNFETTYSDWEEYPANGLTQLPPKTWSGTDLQKWNGEHVIVQYWSRLTGSSAHVQHGDIDSTPRYFPHFFLHGSFNQYGFDAGYINEMFKDARDGLWKFNFMSEWPVRVALNVWGINPDGQPDQTRVYGDIDGDMVLDRIPPLSLIKNLINITDSPPTPYLANQIVLDDANMRYHIISVGNRWIQLTLYLLLWFIPIISGALGIWLFVKFFYQVKFNEIGVSEKKGIGTLAVRRRIKHPGRTVSTQPLMASNLHHPSSARTTANNLPSPRSQGMGKHTEPEIGQFKRRAVLIATMEYDIEDWKIKVKIGGLGVMAQLMGKNLAHQDLVWVIPCVGGVNYPMDTPGQPIMIKILGKQYQVQVQYHVLRNITYVLLDAPIFRQQTQSEPYPPRMDDLDSAIYYSAWNQCIAEALRRFPVDLYHINDYHGAVAPLHLLPDVVPCVLSLHNAEFQGLWPMRTITEREEVCDIYNLDSSVVQRYVQFGEVFNLLHAGASYLRIHQKGFGAVGVSAKYGKRSFARYPILWGIDKVGALPNPDPTDTGAWNKEQIKTSEIPVDEELEKTKPDLKRQAQEWASLKQDAEADLFVFVGRWSQQKGVDLIADCFPSIMEHNSKVQLICVGPVIDLYGSFAALKLARMMEIYPGRVYSKPEFTALPPYIFSGADFALMPSRDEPFGLVAVEFGRKGALCVGARVGGLGQMPGWWFTIESTTTKHIIHQFKIACEEALSSKPHIRAIMRARAAKQRFPVAQWVEDLEKLQSTAIEVSQKQLIKSAAQSIFSLSSVNTPTQSRAHSRSASKNVSRNVSRASSPIRDNSELPPLPNGGLGSEIGPSQVKKLKQRGSSHSADPPSTPLFEVEEADNEEILGTQKRSSRPLVPSLSQYWQTPSPQNQSTPLANLSERRRFSTDSLKPQEVPYSPNLHAPLVKPSVPGTTLSEDWFAESGPNLYKQSNDTLLSLSAVTGGSSDFKLQHVSPFFTDPKKEFTGQYKKKLEKLNGKTSEAQLCIEEYLIKSEKQWYSQMRAAQMGKSLPPSPMVTARAIECHPSPEGSVFEDGRFTPQTPNAVDERETAIDEFLLGPDYVAPKGLKHILRLRIGDWPLYSILLAFGQIIAATSYQITLLTGSVGQAANKLYAIASIYLAGSVLWWLLYRRLKTVYVLSLPFALYGLAFLLIGLAPLGTSISSRGWIQNVATGFYAVASASGSVYFAVNFGDEGGAPVTSWVYRACVIQGTQQIYVVALWYWGSELTKASQHISTGSSPAVASSAAIIPIGVIIACLMWTIGIILLIGLPKYYRQAPGHIPSFYTALFGRKIILWFFVVVIIQNYWLSAPYGRNWLYLWSSQHLPAWGVVILVLIFFIAIWAIILYIFSVLSTHHSWVLPVFAMGLGAPRWAQMLWGISNIGTYVPWAGGPIASAVAGRCLWLWLGVLDAIQGVGFGMILLQTLTRFHVLFTLIAAQVLGSVATILARATAPDKIGPGDVFPDFSAGAMPGLGKAWFWVALLMNLAVPAGFFMFFRKEQLSKP